MKKSEKDDMYCQITGGFLAYNSKYIGLLSENQPETDIIWFIIFDILKLVRFLQMSCTKLINFLQIHILTTIIT